MISQAPQRLINDPTREIMHFLIEGEATSLCTSFALSYSSFRQASPALRLLACRCTSPVRLRIISPS